MKPQVYDNFRDAYVAYLESNGETFAACPVIESDPCHDQAQATHEYLDLEFRRAVQQGCD